MPEEIEVPLEQVHETIHEAAHHEHSGAGLNIKVALSTAMLAVVAALAALMAGHAANEAVLQEIAASNKWSYYQSKSIKEAVLSSKVQLLTAFNKEIDPKNVEKLAEYKKDMETIKEEGEELGRESAREMKQHVVLARAVTFFQIAIALSAIAVLTKKSSLWLGSLALGAIGGVFFIAGLL